MRPQLMDIIVLLIWLSLISIHSSHDVDPPSADQHKMNHGVSALMSPPPSDLPLQPAKPLHHPSHPSADNSNPSSDGSDDPPPFPYSPPPPPPPSKDGRSDVSSKSPVGKPPQPHKEGSASGKEKKQPLGKKLRIWFLGIAGALQVAAVAFLSFRRRQIPRILEKNGTQLGD